MITRILKSFRSGRAVYHNKGSSSKLLRYLAHEAKDTGKEAVYFNQSREDISGAEVMASLDGQGKGLRDVDAKFYSLVISPSGVELEHLGNDPEKLKAYTRQVMENYARTAGGKDGKHLEGNQLVWYATFHHGRQYNRLDAAVKEGLAQPGEAKRGSQLHVHVVVSRVSQDRSRRITPVGSKERFNIQAWQRQNAEDFGRMFGYGKQVHYAKEEQKEGRLRERLEKLGQAHGLDWKYLNPDRVVGLAKEQGFDWKFYRRLRQLENAFGKGLRPPDPYERLAPGRTKSASLPQERLRQSSRLPALRVYSSPDKTLLVTDRVVPVQLGKGLSKRAERLGTAEKSQNSGSLAALSRFTKAMAREASLSEEDWAAPERLRKSKPKRKRVDQERGPER